jgi:hypothetical protein
LRFRLTSYMKLKNIFLVLILLFAGSFLSADAQSRQTVSVLPDFSFFKLDGTSFTRNNMKAGVKSIIIYFDPGCDHCQHEVEAIGKRYNEFKDVAFYLVSANEKTQISSFMQTFGKDLNGRNNVTVLHDPELQFFYKFSPTTFPAIYVYSFQGKLIKQFSGTTKVDDLL